jgi:hypothetical protein
MSEYISKSEPVEPSGSTTSARASARQLAGVPNGPAAIPPKATIEPSALPKLLTEGEVADILGISVKTLRNWRVSGGPLPHIKISRSVRYHPDDVLALIAERRRTSTSDVGNA